MVLVRNICEVEYGHFADVLRGYEELNEICRSRGWKEMRLCVQAGARNNILCADVEFATLQEWEDDTDATMGDPEFMKVMRAASEYIVQGSAREEIWMDAPHLA